MFKANSTEATSHQNVAATAKKKKKNVNVKKGNSILNYLQVKPVWGRAEAGQQHPPTWDEVSDCFLLWQGEDL